MWRRKKFIAVALLVVVVLFGSIGGVVFAQTENENDSQPKTLLARVAEILDIDQQKLEDAFVQARSEMRAEALQNRLADAVEQGILTQEEADQYLEWWQAKPDVQLGGPGLRGFGGGGSHGPMRGGCGMWGG